MIMYVDVVGRCNIKCPSCPIGNTSHQNHVGGSMSVGLFTKIIKKAVNESDLSTVGLYNWTEPLLHPQIGSLIKIVKSYGLGCLVSSNLNLSKNIEQVVEAVPDFLRVTVSGFTNGVYQKQHAGGDIEKVKANMQLLATLIKKHNVKIDIEVYYLRWLGNLDEEVLMQEFAENLGFRFTADWAWMSPVEKTVAILNDDKEHFTDADITTVNSLARPFLETVGVLKKYANVACPYINGVLSLDCSGRVSLCCGVFDQERFSVGNYLDFSLQELNTMKTQDAECKGMCEQCMGYGLHALGGGQDPDLNKLPILYVLETYANRFGSSLAEL